jgi:hypothetical protein
VSPPTGGSFEAAGPNGLRYHRHFITSNAEARLADAVARLDFSTFEMRGVVARRRVAFFGRSYDAGHASPPLPAFLAPLRDRVAAWAGVEAGAFAVINSARPARRSAGTSTDRSTASWQVSLSCRPVE